MRRACGPLPSRSGRHVGDRGVEVLMRVPTVEESEEVFAEGVGVRQNPTPSSIENTTRDGSPCAKLNPSGSALVYSTYFGGIGYDEITALRVDGSGRAFVFGSTASQDFPLESAFQAAHGGGSSALLDKTVAAPPGGSTFALITIASDAFVARIEASGSFGAVEYGRLYPGVDMVVHGRGGELQYDFFVAPHADPKRIAFAIDRAKGSVPLRIGDEGDLIIPIGQGGEARIRRPYAYQEIDGGRARVEASYEIHDRREVGFRLGAYDKKRLLIIDPVLEEWKACFAASDAGGEGPYSRCPMKRQGSAVTHRCQDGADRPWRLS